jgi:hypothetical protein
VTLCDFRGKWTAVTRCDFPPVGGKAESHCHTGHNVTSNPTADPVGRIEDPMTKLQLAVELAKIAASTDSAYVQTVFDGSGCMSREDLAIHAAELVALSIIQIESRPILNVLVSSRKRDLR